MSIQSDIEMLSIYSAELYAKDNNMSIETVNNIFHSHQIFEKMLLQYDYLHQISIDEVMEFITESLKDDSKQLVLFHGTVADFETVLLSKSHNRRDFGTGFYTTLLEDQAKQWAYRLSLRESKNKYFVYQFLFNESESLNVKRFNNMDVEWLEFVKENRIKGGLQHSYDVVIGPVADDNTMETVQLYMSGILSSTEAVERLKYNKLNNQVSFHTEKALELLKLVGRTTYE